MGKIVNHAVANKQTVRPIGSFHSSSPIIETTDILVSMERFQGLVSHNLKENTATIKSGMTLADANRALVEVGLETHNLGDVNTQKVIDAISTGTHGTGKNLTNLATMLIGGCLVTANGEIINYSCDKDPELAKAAQISLGTLGIFTSLTLSLVPAQRLHRTEWCTNIDNCLNHLYQLIEENHNFDFYWYPRSDRAKLRIMNPPQHETKIPFAECVLDKTGWRSEVTSRIRTLKYDEMEYALPAEYGLACFQEIREVIKKKHRKTVAWRILYRTVAPDEAYLSPYYKRQSIAISLHQNDTLPFWNYFKDIEPIFRSYGGRPHWGKKHTLKAKELKKLYPEWNNFLIIREKLDPNGLFLNPYLKDILFEED